MQTIAWDTWAFVETALGIARKDELRKFWQNGGFEPVFANP